MRMKRQFRDFDDAPAPRRLQMRDAEQTTIAEMPTDRSYWVDYMGRVDPDNETYFDEEGYADTLVIDSGPDQKRHERAFLDGNVLLDKRHARPLFMGEIGVRAVFNYKISDADRSRFYVADLRFVEAESIPLRDLDTRPADKDERDYFDASRKTFLPVSAFAFLQNPGDNPENYSIRGDKKLRVAVDALCADSRRRRENKRRARSENETREIENLGKQVETALEATASYVFAHRKLAEKGFDLEQIIGDFAYDNEKMADLTEELREQLTALQRQIRAADGER